jgi:hypothetical protein
MVARNIAGHLEREVQGRPREWRPLVYCWRGGKRSGTLAWFLDQIGFRVHLLDGGYKAFRRVVAAELAQLPLRFGFSVVCGRTGSGKTRLLHALAAAGAQVLEDYAFFADDPELFCAQLEALVEVRGRADVNAWQALARAGRWAEVYAALMAEHYDPMYLKSMQRNFAWRASWSRTNGRRRFSRGRPGSWPGRPCPARSGSWRRSPCCPRRWCAARP